MSMMTLLMKLLFLLALMPITSMGSEPAEHAFTVDNESVLKDQEYCRPFENLRNKSASGKPFEKWCEPQGASVFFCSGLEKFYLLKFPDETSCNEVLRIMRAQIKK